MRVLRQLLAFPMLCFAAGCCCTVKPQPVEQGNPTGSSDVHPGADAATRDIAEREMVRRDQAMRDATKLLKEGDRLRSEGDLESAIRAYQKSVDTIP